MTTSTKTNSTLLYASVVEGMIFGNFPGVSKDIVAGWKLALSFPQFDAKLNNLLFYVADNVDTFLSSFQVHFPPFISFNAYFVYRENL